MLELLQGADDWLRPARGELAIRRRYICVIMHQLDSDCTYGGPWVSITNSKQRARAIMLQTYMWIHAGRHCEFDGSYIRTGRTSGEHGGLNVVKI